MKQIILVAGATGELGGRITKALLDKDAEVRALIRPSSNDQQVRQLESLGVTICRINQWDISELSAACSGISCVVSALAGLRDVIIDAQKLLLEAAVAAGVRKFIPSDYSLDFTRFSHGENRNLDLRREFHQFLDNTSIQSTTIFNGAFMELLTGQMPMILWKQKMVLYWGDGDRRLDFTTMDNTAEYTANAALDPSSPRYLRIAGDQVSPKELRSTVSELTGEHFKLIRPGGAALLGLIIKITKTLAPAKDELYPAWQGMQYMHNMIDRRSQLDHLDNDRYGGIKWKSAASLLQEHLAGGA